MNIIGKDVRQNYYPRVTCDLDIVRKNTSEVMDRASKAGIDVAAVVKCVNGLPEIARIFEEAGCRWMHAFDIQLLPGSDRQTTYFKIGYNY